MMSIGERYTKWVINEVKVQDYTKTAILKGKEIDALKSEGKIVNIENEFKVISDITKTAIPQDILDFFRTNKEVKVVKEEKDVNQLVPSGVYNSILEHANNSVNDRLVISIEHKLEYEQIKAISEKIWNAAEKLVFIISPSTELNGRIITDHNTYENVELARGFIKETEDGITHNVNMIGDFASKTKGQKCTSVLTMRLHKYTFINDNAVQYTIFSELPLPLGRCKIVGTSIPINDRRKIGEEAKNRTVIDLVLVSKYYPFLLNVTEKDALILKKGYTHEVLATKMFGKMRHPEWFEKLMFSIISTHNNYSYPAHFLMIGPAGSGKTRGLLMPLMKSFDEIAGIVSGTSTIKGLIPNFKESPPDIGYLCRAEKLALVDEMFNFIKTSMSNGEGKTNFGILKDVLDHEEKAFASGNGTIKTIMNSILIAVTNDDKFNNLTSVPKICENLDRPFLSRLLIYKQSENHISFVNERKDKVDELGDNAYPKLDQGFISLFGWLSGQKILNFDINKSSKVFEKYLNIIPGIAREVYQGRYRHHLKCIITGICKYRWLINEKAVLTLDDKDYELGEEIFANVIASWVEDDDDIKKLPFRARLNHVDFKEKLVYDVICQQKVGSKTFVDELKKFLDISKAQIELAFYRLKRLELIKVIDIIGKGEFVVPFWYEHGDINANEKK
jgi:hypothetical protein